MPVTPETIQEAGNYLDLWLGGGAASMLASLLGYHKFFVIPRGLEITKQIQTVQSYIKHERDERKKLDPRFSQIQKQMQSENKSFLEFMNWYEEFKHKTEVQLKQVETTEREHYQELRDMKAEDKLIRQELTFVKDKVSGIEESVSSIKNSIEELKTLFLQEALQRRNPVWPNGSILKNQSSSVNVAVA